MKSLKLFSSSFLCVLCISFFAVQNSAASSEQKELEDVACELSFNLKSWSVFYKSGKGKGTISCDNGQSAEVKIRAHGGGITFGKNEIVDGKGTFSKVRDIEKLFGGYAQSQAHAGASSSAEVGALWNGNVGLTLSGKGKGWDLGFALGHFKITPVK